MDIIGFSSLVIRLYPVFHDAYEFGKNKAYHQVQQGDHGISIKVGKGLGGKFTAASQKIKNRQNGNQGCVLIKGLRILYPQEEEWSSLPVG